MTAKRLRRKRINQITGMMLFLMIAGGIPAFAVSLFITEDQFDTFARYYVLVLVIFFAWYTIVGSRIRIRCPFCDAVVLPIGRQPYEDVTACESCGRAFDEDTLDY